MIVSDPQPQPPSDEPSFEPLPSEPDPELNKVIEEGDTSRSRGVTWDGANG
jgi:hypothetical protein